MKMKKKTKIKAMLFLLLSLCMLFGLGFSALAATEEEEFLDELKKILPSGISAQSTEELLSSVGVRGIFSQILGVLSGQRSEILSFLLLCLGSVVLVLAASGLSAHSALSSTAESAASAMLGIAVFLPLRDCVSGAVEMLSEAAAFFGAAAPIMHGITLAAGGTQSAAAGALGAEVTIYIVNLFFSGIVTPVASVIFALGLVSAFGENSLALSSLAGGVKRIFLWLLGLGSTLLGAALALQTVLAAGVDTTAMRTAKYTAAGLIPLVGGAVSASLSTLATGLSFVKTTVGVSVVAALLLLCVPLLLRLLLYRFCLDVSVGFSEFLGIRAAARMFASFRSAMDATVAVSALGTVLFLLQSILFLRAGVAIL